MVVRAVVYVGTFHVLGVVARLDRAIQ